MLRGASKDVLNEIERNLHDALGVTRNVMLNPKLVPGGGAVEMELAQRLLEYAQNIEGVQQWPFKALASAIEVIPELLLRTVVQMWSECSLNSEPNMLELEREPPSESTEHWKNC